MTTANRPDTATAIPTLKLLPAFERALIDHWVGDITPGVQALIAAVRNTLPEGNGGSDGKRAFDERFYLMCRQLERSRLYQAQSAKVAVRTSLDAPAGNAVHWLNLSPVTVTDATFATIARVFLASTEVQGVPDSQRARFRTAARLLFGLPDQCADAVIISAAGRVPIGEVVELPNRVMDLAVGGGQTKQSAKNLRTAVRAAMRFAAERRECPVAFRPAPVVADEWVSVMNTHFPLAATGASSKSIVALRKGVKLLATAAAQAYDEKCIGHRITPEALTRADGDAIVRFIRTRLGKEYDARRAKWALNQLRSCGVGRLAENDHLANFEVRTALGARSALHLRGPRSAGSNDWAKMLDIVASAALPEETVEFLRWYGQWVTLPADAFLEPNCPWPPVLNRHLLSRSSLDRRSNDVRAWIGCAIQICGMDAATLTPARLFGERLDEIGKAVIEWWRARQSVLLIEGRKYGAATKGSLHHIIVSAGILAYAGYVHARHQRGFAAERIDTVDGGRIDILAETMADKTPDEGRFLAGYANSLALAGTLKRLVSAKGKRGRKSVKDETGASRPEFKDIRRIIQHTPPAWWIELLDSMHMGIREAVRLGQGSGREFHLLVQHAWELGLLISTGLRGEEACRLELGVHLKSGEGRVSLTAAERKNVKPQTADLQSRYVPRDIHELYLTSTLPWLRRDEAHHGFLIVNTNGRAPGALLMSHGDDNEADRRFKQAVARHGDRWRAAMMRRAVEAGLRLPDQLEFSFGRHCIRGAFGYAIFQTLGVVAAANYLGDSTETVELAYAAVEGINVDVSLVAGFAIPERGIGASITPPPAIAQRHTAGSEERYLEKEAQLRADLRDGVIGREEYDQLLGQYKRVYLGEERIRLAS
jgi:hypothetical protein